MKLRTLIYVPLLAICLSACTTPPQMQPKTYMQISAQEAKEKMQENPNAIILDVREQDEFDSGHIPSAVLLPVGTISENSASALIPTKDSIVLVYCRRGNRSKTASAALVALGYTQVYEFGGILDWPYDIEQ